MVLVIFSWFLVFIELIDYLQIRPGPSAPLSGNLNQFTYSLLVKYLKMQSNIKIDREIKNRHQNVFTCDIDKLDNKSFLRD
jgi:hypothetical protein